MTLSLPRRLLTNQTSSIELGGNFPWSVSPRIWCPTLGNKTQHPVGKIPSAHFGRKSFSRRGKKIFNLVWRGPYRTNKYKGSIRSWRSPYLIFGLYPREVMQDFPAFFCWNSDPMRNEYVYYPGNNESWLKTCQQSTVNVFCSLDSASAIRSRSRTGAKLADLFTYA